MVRTSSIRLVSNRYVKDTEGPDSMYIVDLYEDGVLKETRELPGKGVCYALDVSENWNNGIIKLEKK
jgi:hypothetical protein